MAKKKKKPLFEDELPKYSSKSAAYKKLSSMGANVKGGKIEITTQFLMTYEAYKRTKGVREAIISASSYYVSDALKTLKRLENLAERQNSLPRKELYEDMAKTNRKKMNRLQDQFKIDPETGEQKLGKTRQYIAALSSLGSFEKGLTEAFKKPKQFGSGLINAKIVAIMANAFARKMFLDANELTELESIAAEFGFDLKGKMESDYADYSRMYSKSDLGETLARAADQISVLGFNSDQFIQNVVDAAEHIQNILVNEKATLTDAQMQLINRFFYIYEGAKGF